MDKEQKIKKLLPLTLSFSVELMDFVVAVVEKTLSED